VTHSWPRALINWYHAHARVLPWRNPPGQPLPDDADWPYRVWLSEIMLQQTTVEAASPYFAVFTARWPDVAALAAAADADVMQAWAGLGYYARARHLLACARAVVAAHGGQFPADLDALRALPGIGDYTAAAVLAFGFGRDAQPVDGNIERVMARLLALETPLPAARRAIAAALAAAQPPGQAADLAQGLMDLARRICTARNPACLACPIAADCAAHAAGRAGDFPIKPARRARPTRRGTAWWIEADGHVAICTRPPRGLLGGMPALPSCDWRGGGAPPLAGVWVPLGRVAHGFTHFDLELAVEGLWLAERPALAGAAWWPRDAVAAGGLPTVFAKAARLALAADAGQMAA
jgi:A/G-specific adenine glycosylase